MIYQAQQRTHSRHLDAGTSILQVFLSASMIESLFNCSECCACFEAINVVSAMPCQASVNCFALLSMKLQDQSTD